MQASRLAMCLVATGDAARRADASCSGPPARCREIIGGSCSADTSAILWALVTQKPDLTGWQPVHDWLRGELAKLA